MKKLAVLLAISILITGFAWARGKGEEKKPAGTDAPRELTPPAVSEEPAAGGEAMSLSPAQKKLGPLGFEFPANPVKAPDFELPMLEGGTKTLSSYQGSIVFLNFWATWCPPCRLEMPSMEKLHQSLKNEKFAIVAVNLKEDQPTAAQFIKENKYTYQVLLDESGQVGGGMYGVEGIPTTYIIGKDGYILGRIVGTREWDGDDVLSVFRDLIKG